MGIEYIADTRLKQGTEGSETILGAPLIPEEAPVAVHIGAGTLGRTLKHVFPDSPVVKQAGNGAYILEVDISAKTTKRVAEANEAGVFAVRSSADHIPVRDASVDELYASNVVGEPPTAATDETGQPFYRTKATFKEFERVLKDTGVIVIEETTTPGTAARVLKNIDFDDLGFVWEMTQDDKEIGERLRKFGAGERRVGTYAAGRRMITNPTAEKSANAMSGLVFDPNKPLLLILRKKPATA